MNSSFLALAMYADEPCRVCGKILTMHDILQGAVFAGYSKDNKSRVAHKTCWAGFTEMLSDLLGSDVDIDAMINTEFKHRRQAVMEGDTRPIVVVITQEAGGDSQGKG